MNRRRFLAVVGGPVAVAVAGCLGVPGGIDGSTPTPRETWRDEVTFDGVDREVYVEGRSYAFTPGSDEPIIVGDGERVGLAFTSLDSGYHMGHGLAIAAFDVDLRAIEGAVASTTFLADGPGEYEVHCSVPCSAGHPDMLGTLVIA